jgi:hypothetical protein
MPASDAVQRMLDTETRGFFTRTLYAIMGYISGGERRSSGAADPISGPTLTTIKRRPISVS